MTAKQLSGSQFPVPVVVSGPRSSQRATANTASLSRNN